MQNSTDNPTFAEAARRGLPDYSGISYPNLESNQLLRIKELLDDPTLYQSPEKLEEYERLAFKLDENAIEKPIFTAFVKIGAEVKTPTPMLFDLMEHQHSDKVVDAAFKSNDFYTIRRDRTQLVLMFHSEQLRNSLAGHFIDIDGKEYQIQRPNTLKTYFYLDIIQASVAFPLGKFKEACRKQKLPLLLLTYRENKNNHHLATLRAYFASPACPAPIQLANLPPTHLIVDGRTWKLYPKTEYIRSKQKNNSDKPSFKAWNLDEILDDTAPPASTFDATDMEIANTNLPLAETAIIDVNTLSTIPKKRERHSEDEIPVEEQMEIDGVDTSPNPTPIKRKKVLRQRNITAVSTHPLLTSSNCATSSEWTHSPTTSIEQLEQLPPTHNNHFQLELFNKFDTLRRHIGGNPYAPAMTPTIFQLPSELEDTEPESISQFTPQQVPKIPHTQKLHGVTMPIPRQTASRLNQALFEPTQDMVPLLTTDWQEMPLTKFEQGLNELLHSIDHTPPTCKSGADSEPEIDQLVTHLERKSNPEAILTSITGKFRDVFIFALQHPTTQFKELLADLIDFQAFNRDLLQSSPNMQTSFKQRTSRFNIGKNYNLHSLMNKIRPLFTQNTIDLTLHRSYALLDLTLRIGAPHLMKNPILLQTIIKHGPIRLGSNGPTMWDQATLWLLLRTPFGTDLCQNLLTEFDTSQVYHQLIQLQQNAYQHLPSILKD